MTGGKFYLSEMKANNESIWKISEFHVLNNITSLPVLEE